jgi:hypothetical protein
MKPSFNLSPPLLQLSSLPPLLRTSSLCRMALDLYDYRCCCLSYGHGRGAGWIFRGPSFSSTPPVIFLPVSSMALCTVMDRLLLAPSWLKGITIICNMFAGSNSYAFCPCQSYHLLRSLIGRWNWIVGFCWLGVNEFHAWIEGSITILSFAISLAIFHVFARILFSVVSLPQI